MTNLTYVGKELISQNSNLILGVEQYRSQILFVEVYIDNALLEENLAIYIMFSVFWTVTPLVGIYPMEIIMNCSNIWQNKICDCGFIMMNN